MSGNPIGGVDIRLVGPVDRSAKTEANGAIVFRSLRAGTYRMRFEHEGFTSFERETTLRAGQPASISVALTRAPAPTPSAVPAPAIPAPAPAPTGPPVEPRVMSIPDFLDKQLIRSSEPQKTSLLACAPGGTTRLLQVREPLTDQVHADADEILYVIAGEGTLRISENASRIQAGYFAVVPRGTEHAISRQGRNPLILVSVLAGAPCVGDR